MNPGQLLDAGYTKYQMADDNGDVYTLWRKGKQKPPRPHVLNLHELT